MSTPLASPSIQDIIQSARNLLNQPDPNNSNWTDGELLSYVNEGIRIYAAELINENEGYFTTSTTLNITSGQEYVTLPSDFFKIRALYKVQSNGNCMLQYKNNVTDGYMNNGGTSTELYTPYYYFRQNTIVLRPPPQFSQTGGLLLEYCQMPESMITGGDSLTGQISPMFRQVIEMYCVYKAKLKESMVTGVNTFQIAAENLRDLSVQFKDLTKIRSKNPTFVVPFMPENS